MSKEYRDILGRYTAMYLKWEREPRKRSGKRGMALAQYCCFSSSSIGRGALQTCEIFEKVLNFSEQDI